MSMETRKKCKYYLWYLPACNVNHVAYLPPGILP